MAMLRSRGERSLTTVPPIRILPSVMSSRPATIRNAVDLPQPDGPTRTRHLPSSITRSREWSARSESGYCLLALSKTISAIASGPDLTVPFPRIVACEANEVKAAAEGHYHRVGERTAAELYTDRRRLEARHGAARKAKCSSEVGERLGTECGPSRAPT